VLIPFEDPGPFTTPWKPVDRSPRFDEGERVRRQLVEAPCAEIASYVHFEAAIHGATHPADLIASAQSMAGRLTNRPRSNKSEVCPKRMSSWVRPLLGFRAWNESRCVPAPDKFLPAHTLEVARRKPKYV